MWRSARPPFLDRFPLWSFFPIGIVLIVAGSFAIGALLGNSGQVTPKVSPLQDAPLWVLVLVPVVEALLWTVAFTEGFAYAFRAPLLGALFGLFAYVLYHFSKGMLGIVTSAWLGAVWSYLYVVMRERSRWAAFINLVCLRWAFVALAYVSIGRLA
jgi:hypothetical protein